MNLENLMAGGINVAGLAAYLLGGALMVVGAVELLRRLSFWLHNGGAPGPQPGQGKLAQSELAEGKFEECKFALVVQPAGPQDCEALIRAGGQRVEWMALKPPCRLICLDSGDPEVRAIAARLALRYPGLELCAPKELPGLLAGPGTEEREGRRL